jgi:transcriptional regulator with XRE-family HTH domain
MSIGETIKKIRLKNRLTLEGLAVASGLSKGCLSKVERGKDVPRLSTLQRIANGLSVEISAFFEINESESVVDHNYDWMKKAQREPHEIETPQGGYSYQTLVHHSRGKFMSPFLLRVEKGQTSSFKHDSEEFLLVQEGSVIVEYDQKEFLLNAGDSLYFNSRITHRFRNDAKKPAVLLVVNFDYKRF